MSDQVVRRRLGTAPAARGTCTSGGNCPDVFELESGDFVIIGELADDLDGGAARVTVPREVMLSARDQLIEEG